MGDAKPKAAAGKQAPWARLGIAIVPGYIATVIISAGLTSLLPIHRSEATWLSLFLAGLIYTGLFIYIFAVPTWLRALRDLVGATLVFGLILALRRGLLF